MRGTHGRAGRGIGGKARTGNATPQLPVGTGNAAPLPPARTGNAAPLPPARTGNAAPLPPAAAGPPSVCGEGGGRSRCAPYFRKKYRLLLTERAVCVIMRPKIVRCGLFLAKECRQILSARRVLPPSAGSCAYLCGSVAAGSAAGKPLRRLQLHRFTWRTYLSLVEYRSASMLIYIDVGGGYYVFY